MIKCKNCNKCFDRIFNYQRHLDNCKGNSDDMQTIGKHQKFGSCCPYCESTYVDNSKLNRHLSNVNGICYKNRHPHSSSLNPIINNIKNVKNVNNIGQITTNSTNIIQPIFAKHGKETIEHITREILLELLDSDNFPKMCTEMMRLLYFNKNVPHNSNWMIAYPKDQKAGVEYDYNLNQFERKSTIDVIDDKFSNMIDLFQPLIEEICREDERNNILNARQKRNISIFYEHVGMLEISKESPEVYYSIHEMAYKNKIVATTIWKEQGLNGKHLSLKF